MPDDAEVMPKYPHIAVDLSECSGNAYALVAKVRHAMTEAGVPQVEIEAMSKEAMSGDYDHVLQTLVGIVDVI